jgi:hypothetical protein
LGNGSFVDGIGYGMLSTLVSFWQIETASVGEDFGGSRLNHDTKGGGYMFYTNSNRVRVRGSD